MMTKIIVILLIYLSFEATLIACEDLYPNCSRDQFDEDVSKIVGLFGVKGVEFPTDDDEMDQYCSLAKKNEELTKYYIDRCLKGYSKTIMFVFSNNLRVFLAQFCGENATEREKFIGWSECGNKAKAAGTNRCWNRLLTNLWKTRLIEDSQDKVPAMCCNFLGWKSCTMNVLKEVEECDEDAIEGYNQQLMKSSLDVLTAVCDEYFEEPTMCIEALEYMPRFSPSQRRKVYTKTPFLQMFQIFESLH